MESLSDLAKKALGMRAPSDPEEVTDSDNPQEECTEPEGDGRKDRDYQSPRVVIVVVLTTVMLGLAIYIFKVLRKSETDAFHTSHYDYSSQVFTSVQERVLLRFEAIESLSSDIMSFAASNNKTWPQVVVPDFEVRAATIGRLAGAQTISMLPLVTQETLGDYESFVANEFAQWYADSVAVRAAFALPSGLDYDMKASFLPNSPRGFSNRVFVVPDSGKPADVAIPVQGEGPFLPVWQTTPPQVDSINAELLSVHPIRDALTILIESGQAVLGMAAVVGGSLVTNVAYPIFDTFQRVNLVGALALDVTWESLFTGILPPNADGIVCVIENSCDQSFTFEIDGERVVFLGEGDLHDRSYDNMLESMTFAQGLQDPTVGDLSYLGVPVNDDFCEYILHVYPSDTLKDIYVTQKPLAYAMSAIILLLFLTVLFVAYDKLVERRQEKVTEAAVNVNAIASSVFPTSVRHMLMNDEKKPKKSAVRGSSPESYGCFDTKPIVNDYPVSTILFADIVGFSAWSEEREPDEIFILLETVYRAFDAVAKARSVFKVETVGDCYVAVTGVPQAQEDHAELMVCFAQDCMSQLREVTKLLEPKLGPDTCELAWRVGIHTGPVSAGVLRGGQSRFQLFGDTMNTSARMETNGLMSRIHASQATVDALTARGFGNWAVPRGKKVFAKGKGELQTYWIDPTRTLASTIEKPIAGEQTQQFRRGPPSSMDVGIELGDATTDGDNEATQRLIDWNTELLLQLLKQIVARRKKHPTEGSADDAVFDKQLEPGETYIDEMTDVVSIPRADPDAETEDEIDAEDVTLDPRAKRQLKGLVTRIAMSYQDHPFHNFKHASHVVMSVNKLLKRVAAVDGLAKNSHKRNLMMNEMDAQKDTTFGITDDPLTQFAVIFSALVHDVDHCGVSNAQLVEENADIAVKFQNRSVAEQNSIDVAWALLMEPRNKQLQECMFSTEEEFSRFRQLLVNIVLATDIFDKQLSRVRKQRWNQTFGFNGKKQQNPSSEEDVDRIATIVIEHVIQASDVAHTMQHFSTYKKWNKRLFREMYMAFKNGRMKKDPSKGWYIGEMIFFDSYVIPLAKKIQECGVFGVAGDQCKKYAMSNRKQWEQEGQAFVNELIAEVTADHS